jgi:hypothetical protein
LNDKIEINYLKKKSELAITFETSNPNHKLMANLIEDKPQKITQKNSKKNYKK